VPGLRGRRRLGIGRIVIFATIMLAGVVLALVIAIPQIDSAVILAWLGYRFFEVNNEVIYQTFYVYPQYLPHTLGMNIGLLHSLFGTGELLSAHTRVANFFGAPDATFDSFFIGDAWVDFSYGGVIVMSLVVGFAVKAVDIFVMSLGKTPLSLALLGSCMYGLFQLQVTSAFTAFLSGGLVFIPLLAFASAGLVNDLSRSDRRLETGRAPHHSSDAGRRRPGQPHGRSTFATRYLCHWLFFPGRTQGTGAHPHTDVRGSHPRAVGPRHRSVHGRRP